MESIVILASGRGTNFDAIALAIEEGRLDAKIEALITDNSKATVIGKAQKLGIPVRLLSENVSADTRNSELLGLCEFFAPDYLVLAGYMRKLPLSIIKAFQNRITNIHPSLLPAFPGLNAYRQAFNYGAKMSGVTVHLVDEKIDNGPILAQEAFNIANCSSEYEVEKIGLEIENRLYPETLSWVLSGRFQVEEREGRYSVRAC